MKHKASPRRNPPHSPADLRARLREAEETLRAIRAGEVDALIVDGPEGDQVFTLKGADHAYRIMVEEMQEGTVTLTTAGVVLYCNRRFAELVGLPLEQLIGSVIWNHIISTDRNPQQNLIRLSAAKVGREEILLRQADGEPVPCLVSATAFETDGMRAICLICTDLTEQKRSEEKFRLIIENARDYSFCMTDKRGFITTWTTAAERMYGYNEKEVVGKSIALLRNGDEDDLRSLRRSLDIAAQTGHSEEEGVRVRKDGTRFKANVIMTALRHADGSLRGFSRITRDVTEQHQLQREIVEAGTHEQRRIGLDLHDNLCQQLTGISYMIEILGQDLPAPSAAAAKLTRVQDLLTKALHHARTLAHGLCPIELSGSNLGSALRQFAHNIQELYGIVCQVQLGSLKWSDNYSFAPTQVYHIIQEAVTNAIKHGKAKRIKISLSSHRDIITLIIKDNGIGFDKTNSPSSGIGMQTMKYRVGLIGGTLHVSSILNVGTTVRCAFQANYEKLMKRSRKAKRDPELFGV
jgi:PAS domain S-box-containing protein